MDGKEKSRCKLPDSIIENVVKRRKGLQFYDTEEDSVCFIYNKTVIAAVFEEGGWVVTTVYRHSNPRAKFEAADRYESINVDRYVENMIQ